MLGSQVIDIVTRLEGIVVAKLEYLNGCIRYEVQPQGLTKDGDPKSSKWIDVQQLRVIEADGLKGEYAAKDPVGLPGGGRSAPPAMSRP